MSASTPSQRLPCHPRNFLSSEANVPVSVVKAVLLHAHREQRGRHTCVIIVLLVKHLTDAVAQLRVSPNFRQYCSLKVPVVNVKLDDNEVSWLTYAPDDIQRMRGLGKVICYWCIVEVQPAQIIDLSLLHCRNARLCACKHTESHQIT